MRARKSASTSLETSFDGFADTGSLTTDPVMTHFRPRSRANIFSYLLRITSQR